MKNIFSNFFDDMFEEFPAFPPSLWSTTTTTKLSTRKVTYSYVHLNKTEDDEIIYKVDIPGYILETFKLTIEDNNFIRVKYNRVEEHINFTFQVLTNYDVFKAKARVKNGQLMITIPIKKNISSTSVEIPVEES